MLPRVWVTLLSRNLSRRTLNVHDVTFTTIRYLFYSPKKKPLLGLFALVSNKKLHRLRSLLHTDYGVVWVKWAFLDIALMRQRAPSARPI